MKTLVNPYFDMSCETLIRPPGLSLLPPSFVCITHALQLGRSFRNGYEHFIYFKEIKYRFTNESSVGVSIVLTRSARLLFHHRTRYKGIKKNIN